MFPLHLKNAFTVPFVLVNSSLWDTYWCLDILPTWIYVEQCKTLCYYIIYTLYIEIIIYYIIKNNYYYIVMIKCMLI